MMGKLVEKWNQTKTAKKLRNVKLTKKLVVIYVFLVLVPGVLTVYIMNVNYYNILWEKYCGNVDDIYFSEVETLEIRLNDISKISAQFTSNSVLVEYADTAGMSVADSVYDYLKYLKSIFQTARSSNQYVSSLTMYTRAQHPFEMTGILENLEEDSVPEEVMESISGNWIVECLDGEIVLNYYQPIYTSGYSTFLGVLKVEVDLYLVMNCFTEEQVFFCSDSQEVQFLKTEETFEPVSMPVTNTQREKKHFSYVSERRSELLKGVFAIELVMPDDFLYSVLEILLPTLLMLMLLPLIYLGIMRKQIRRIQNLSEYIGRNYAADARPYKEAQESMDEIGMLIHAYNHYIFEINRLLKAVDTAELQRKDSEFYALQAQIKPHFLYNTLENIRMTAEQENDPRTASMLAILGGYMRYGMKKDQKYTYLSGELQHVKNYQQLMDIRFPGQIRLKISAYTDISEITCPYLIFQPIIENAVKHGMEPDKAMDINIEIRDAEKRKKKDIEIRIRNNGREIEKGQLAELRRQMEAGISDADGHVGLNNVNYRLISCYGRDYYMRIDGGKSQGCLFVIYLPVRKDI